MIQRYGAPAVRGIVQNPLPAIGGQWVKYAEHTEQIRLWRDLATRNHEAFTAMRNDLNEIFPMQSAEADLLESPDASTSCAAITTAAQAWAQSQRYLRKQLEAQIEDRDVMLHNASETIDALEAKIEELNKAHRQYRGHAQEHVQAAEAVIQDLKRKNKELTERAALSADVSLSSHDPGGATTTAGEVDRSRPASPADASQRGAAMTRPDDMEGLIERLRSKYRIPILDGLGPAGGEEPDNPNEFVRTFDTPPIQKEAADALASLKAEVDEFRSSLAKTIGKLMVADKRAEKAEAEVARLTEALRATTASLVAAHSLLSRGSKKAAPSDKMFDQMLLDYQKSIDVGRAALSADASPAQSRKEVLEEAAIAVDKAWREKGGINCTEVCAIIRAAAIRPKEGGDA